jgi:SAM-dependent methyltransferase
MNSRVRPPYRALYRLGMTPWDSAVIPPAVITTVTAMAGHGGKAVDLGCGTGRQARYLAAHGWQVTAVDYVPAAIEIAREQDPDGRVTWRVADVTEQAAVDPDGQLSGAVTVILDNGCLHGIPGQRRVGWARTVSALAASGCLLLVRAAPRRRSITRSGIRPSGIDPDELTALLGGGWRRNPSPGVGWHLYTRVATPLLRFP